MTWYSFLSSRIVSCLGIFVVVLVLLLDSFLCRLHSFLVIRLGQTMAINSIYCTPSNTAVVLRCCSLAGRNMSFAMCFIKHRNTFLCVFLLLLLLLMLLVVLLLHLITNCCWIGGAVTATLHRQAGSRQSDTTDWRWRCSSASSLMLLHFFCLVAGGYE